MSLRQRLYAYLISTHLLFFALTITLYRSAPLWMLGLEAAVMLSLALGLHLIRRALEPLNYTRHFHDLLQDQHYAARLQHSGDAELNELVQLFNTMLNALYQERLQIGEQQGFLDRLLEATPSAVIVFDFDGRISLLNASAQALLGLEDAKGKPLRAWLADAAPADSTAATPAAGANAKPDETPHDKPNEKPGNRSESRSENSPGLAASPAGNPSLLAQLDALPLGDSRLLSDADGRRYRAQRGHFYDRGFTRDFLLIEELTEELESSEKATYDKLIRVLAHEVNNTVAATGSVLDSLLYYRDQLAERDGEDFSTAIVAVKRRNVSLGEFIERFTRVVKMPAPEPRPSAVKDIMDDILYLYREPCRSRGIRIAWRRCDEVAPVALDRHLFEQALLNVVKNAMEAVETSMLEAKHAADGGAHGTAGTDSAGGAADGQAAGAVNYIEFELAREADGVHLAVIDSGDRLGDVPARQLFTPFFTTKKGGQGIGLLFVREVLNRHGFHYRLAATGQGATRFDIRLA